MILNISFSTNCATSCFIRLKLSSTSTAEVRAAALNPSMAYRTNLFIHGSFDYPDRLREAEEPVEVLYYAGHLDYLSTRSVAIVGTRKPSEEGLRQAEALTRFMVAQDFTIVSGLAMGIDTMAHTTAIMAGGRTVAVIGTPLDQAYPAVNSDLQKKIAREHLLISQVPFIRYREQSINGNRLFFPERNKTMSALTEATIIVEAGQTSGTLIQARAAVFQRRKLFILDQCFQNKSITCLPNMSSRAPSVFDILRKFLNTCLLIISMSNLVRIDELVIGEHGLLSMLDECYYLLEYTAREGYSYSASNDLIQNLKKPMDRRGRLEWKWNAWAIQRIASELASALPVLIDFASTTIIPIPPSKIRSNPLYDDRLLQILQKA